MIFKNCYVGRNACGVMSLTLVIFLLQQGMWDEAWTLVSSMHLSEVVPNMEAYMWLMYASVTPDHCEHQLNKV